MTLPDWWVTATGMAAILICVAALVWIVLALALIWVALDARGAIQTLKGKVEKISDKVDAIAGNVKQVSEDASVRAQGFIKYVDESSPKAFTLIEKGLPYLLALGVVLRVARKK